MDPLNGDAAALYLHKPEDYKKKVREYVLRFATADMANSLSQSINGQSPSKDTSTNQTNKHESDDEALSDFSEDEAANMDLE